MDFMTQTRLDLAGLRSALTTQNLPARVRIAHRMKGSSRMVGAQDLAAACEAMERAVGASSPEEAMTTWTGRWYGLKDILRKHPGSRGATVVVAEGLIVLVVEDDDFQRRTVARMLRSMGALEVIEAGDGKQALDLLLGTHGWTLWCVTWICRRWTAWSSSAI